MFRTNYNLANHPKRYGSINNEPSQTRPDMSYSVRELLEKYTRGTMPSILKDPLFSEDLDLDQDLSMALGDFDLADATYELDRINKYLSEAERIKKTEQLEKIAQKKLQEAEFEEWRKEQEAKKAELQKAATIEEK